VIFVHQQGGNTLVTPRTKRYHPFNTIGNLADRTVTFASLVFGGVMDRCPDLKICLAHGGGYTCFGIGRMDRGWQVRSEARAHIRQPPSTYLGRFYYDCITPSEPALRMIIDRRRRPRRLRHRLARRVGSRPQQPDPRGGFRNLNPQFRFLICALSPACPLVSFPR
jgi:predicted TIM-barrel fold metal-dependent hydrolase